jgi:hypothetical protein
MLPARNRASVSESGDTMERVYQELEYILESYPAEEVIAQIEARNPDWKHDLLPWKIAQPGEAIPWQAVYILKPMKEGEASIAWAKKRLAELKASGDVS